MRRLLYKIAIHISRSHWLEAFPFIPIEKNILNKMVVADIIQIVKIMWYTRKKIRKIVMQVVR